MLTVGLCILLLAQSTCPPALLGRLTASALIAAALAWPASGFFTFSGLFEGSSSTGLVCAFAALLVTLRSTRDAPLLALFGAIGGALLVSSQDLVSLYLALELQSFALYLVAASAGGAVALTGALRYYFVGALGSTLLLVGVAITYAMTGTTSLAGLQALMETSSSGEQVGLSLIAVGLLFKVAAAPMHTWAAQVYESARYPVGAWLVVMPKLSIVALLALNPWTPNLLRIAALASLIVGCLVSLVQDRIKRLLAYSAVGHVGFMLMCSDPAASLLYLGIYAATTALTFLALDSLGVDRRALLSGVLRQHPGIAVALLVALFSMAGVPPLAGFYAKFAVLGASLNEGHTLLVLVGILASVISAFVYLRLATLLAEPREGNSAAASSGPAYVLASLSTALVTFGINPELAMGAAAVLVTSL